MEQSHLTPSTPLAISTSFSYLGRKIKKRLNHIGDLERLTFLEVFGDRSALAYCFSALEICIYHLKLSASRSQPRLGIAGGWNVVPLR